MSNYTHKGFELVVTPESNFWKGECKELGYYNSATTIGLLHLRFIKFVNDREDEKVKNQFSVVVDNYTLKVTEFDGNRPWRGVCEEIGFDWGGFIFLEDLVKRFREKIEQKELQPEVIEYRGFELTVTREQVGNAWFVGKSTFREDWLVASASKKYVEECFRRDVDEKLEKEKIIATVQEAKKGILSYQLNLEAFLERRGYVVRIADNSVCSYGRYAVHPDYYEQWRDETDDNFPDWAVIKLW